MTLIIEWIYLFMLGLKLTHVKKWGPGARLTKAYDVTIQRYRISYAKIDDSKMHILRCVDSKICMKLISHKILNSYTAKYAFYEVLKI